MRCSQCLLALVLLLIAGCQEQDGEEPGREVGVVEGEMLTFAPIIGQPLDAVVAGSKLWLRDASGDPDLHVVDPADGKVLRSAGRRGGGPTELSGAPGNMQADPTDDGSIWVFDGSRQSLIRFGAESEDSAARFVRIRGGPAVIGKAVWLETNRGVGFTADPEAAFVFFDHDGQVTASLPGEMLGSDSIPMTARIHATITRFSVCVRPGGNRFAIIYGHAAQIAIHRADTAERTLADVPVEGSPNFESDRARRHIVFKRQSVFYLACSATRDRLYALYSGKPVDGTAAGSALLARTIHVFDWEGRFVGSVSLDTGISGLAVDDGRRLIYGTSLETAAIYSFYLPKVLQ